MPGEVTEEFSIVEKAGLEERRRRRYLSFLPILGPAICIQTISSNSAKPIKGVVDQTNSGSSQRHGSWSTQCAA